MKILFEISSENAAKILLPLASACNRSNVSWGCFFTGDGVKILSDNAVTALTENAVNAVVCELSWERHMGDQPCPVAMGSQTNNSTFVGDAGKVISL